MMNTSFVIAVVLVALSSYLLGSVNASLVVCKVTGKEDIRKFGSGNAGMTNMLRTYGKSAAAATAFGDFIKAVIAVILSRYIFAWLTTVSIDPGYIAGFFVMIGHSYPLYFGFKGGKGVMCTIGTITSINPLIFAALAAICLPLILITRIVSLASIFGAILFPIFVFVSLHLRGLPVLYETVSAAIIGGWILYLHRSNIQRLLNGTENRFGSKKK
jgi:acyl-phosphate glycerol 3-phosphate acyltransferase